MKTLWRRHRSILLVFVLVLAACDAAKAPPVSRYKIVIEVEVDAERMPQIVRDSDSTHIHMSGKVARYKSSIVVDGEQVESTEVLAEKPCDSKK